MTVVMFHNMSISPMPSTTTPVRSGSRPQRSPPRNSNGEITCTHLDCRIEQPVFKRLCEYNKHMDKHERPYKCSNPACRKNPGFTYAGGLLRHQREVHSMHRTKDPFFCPHSSCNRSAGAGFSRRENLEEHLRRRHSGISIDDTTTNGSTTGNESTVKRLEPLPDDRKRNVEANDDNRGLDITNDRASEVERLRLHVSSLEQDNERLRMELFRRDQIISDLSQETKRLRGVLPQPLLPAHPMYQPPPLD